MFVIMIGARNLWSARDFFSYRNKVPSIISTKVYMTRLLRDYNEVLAFDTMKEINTVRSSGPIPLAWICEVTAAV